MGLDINKIQPKALTEAEEQPMIPAAPGKAVEELIKNVQDSLKAMVELFNLSPAITDEDKSKLGGIIKEYNELVNENLGAAPGEPINKKETPVTFDKVSPEAGIAKVIPAL